MSSQKKFCPVPFDQQPLNEYKSLKKSPLFSFSATDFKTFVNRLILIFVGIITLGLSVTIFSLSLSKLSVHIIVYNVLCALFSIEVLLVRLYLGWSYVLKRLASASIFYEESGWYDGQLWIKSADILTQDRLVGVYQVEPLVVRIRSLLILISSIVVLLFIFLFLFS
uniref:Ycf36 n=1 Tax=Liagoropsis maxima TaxID=1653392 RepID=A0A1G4NVW3_9FLOR|nr:Hypothetical protein ycf36 [Liagoropsis maxima]SCW22800.1 Hypothetical protein ycf36 [Liagoropsis maxima]